MNKHIKTLGFILTACFIALSCRNNEKTETPYSEYEKPENSNEVQKMKDYHYSAKVEAFGKSYTYDIVREVNDTLPTIKDDTGLQYADNYIRLRINENGKEIFNKLFTKNTFRSYLEKDFIQHALLEGMAFDRITTEGLRFSASISYPNSDIYIPLAITISRNGSYTIVKDDVLDTMVEDTVSSEDTEDIEGI